MANIITNNLIANITSVEDATQNVPINRSTGNPAFDAVVAQYTEAFVIVADPTVITLPSPVIYQVYIRNVDPSGHVARVNWQFQGGGVTIEPCVLYPGDQIILWQKQGGANAGITVLSIGLGTASPSVVVEMFLGG